MGCEREEDRSCRASPRILPPTPVHPWEEPETVTGYHLLAPSLLQSKTDTPPSPSSMCSVFLLYCHIAPSNNIVLKIAQINFRAFLDLLAPKPLVL